MTFSGRISSNHIDDWSNNDTNSNIEKHAGDINDKKDDTDYNNNGNNKNKDHTGLVYPFVILILCLHYNDVIMSAIESQITSLTIVYSTVYRGADHRKHQSSASLVFVRGIHRRPVNSPRKGPVTRKMFDVIMLSLGMLGPSILLICLSFLDHRQPVLAIICLLVTFALVGCFRLGHHACMLDIAPRLGKGWLFCIWYLQYKPNSYTLVSHFINMY